MLQVTSIEYLKQLSKVNGRAKIKNFIASIQVLIRTKKYI